METVEYLEGYGFGDDGQQGAWLCRTAATASLCNNAVACGVAARRHCDGKGVLPVTELGCWKGDGTARLRAVLNDAKSAIFCKFFSGRI